MNFRILAAPVGPRGRVFAVLAATALAASFVTSEVHAQAPAPAPKAAEPAKAEAPKPAPAPTAPAATGSAAVPPAVAKPAPAAAPAVVNGARVFASPLARRLAKESGIEIAAISGTGPHGRVVRTVRVCH